MVWQISYHKAGGLYVWQHTQLNKWYICKERKDSKVNTDKKGRKLCLCGLKMTKHTVRFACVTYGHVATDIWLQQYHYKIKLGKIGLLDSLPLCIRSCCIFDRTNKDLIINCKFGLYGTKIHTKTGLSR